MFVLSLLFHWIFLRIRLVGIWLWLLWIFIYRVSLVDGDNVVCSCLSVTVQLIIFHGKFSTSWNARLVPFNNFWQFELNNEGSGSNRYRTLVKWHKLKSVFFLKNKVNILRTRLCNFLCFCLHTSPLSLSPLNRFFFYPTDLLLNKFRTLVVAMHLCLSLFKLYLNPIAGALFQAFT